MLRLLLILLLLIPFLGGLFFIRDFDFGKLAPTSVKSFVEKVIHRNNSKIDVKVLYTEDGFSPNVLEISLNTKVAFVNSSDIPLWVASDPHPVHSDFNEFDALKDYGRNQVYIFQFTKAGTFGFHNHAKSIHRGIIRVVDKDNPMPNIDKTLDFQREKRDSLLSMLKIGDTSSIFKVIDTIEADYVLSNDCHDMAHDIGHKAYEMYGFSGAMTFNDPNRHGHASVDDICAGGYMHGILEELFLHQPTLKENPEPICGSIPDVNRDSCFHGVGHGLMFVNKRDIPASLNTCSNLEDFVDEHRCYEGVWMEMFWGETTHAGADTLGFNLNQPLQKCVQAEETQKPTCFLYAHLGYLRTHHRDFTGALNLCTNNGLDENSVKFCVKGVGITMMKHVTSRHLEQSEKLVENLDYGRKFAYYEGVIGYARLSNVKEADLIIFCNSLKNDAFVCGEVLKTDP